jgi:hypothetical protein
MNRLSVATPPRVPAILVRFAPKQRLVRMTYAHSPTILEWQAVMDLVVADPGYRPGYAFLVDQRGNRNGSTSAFVTEMIHYLRVRSDRIRDARWAVVVDGPAPYGMARAGRTLANDLSIEMEVFQGDSVEKAERWVLGTARNTPCGWLETPALKLAS